MNRFLLGILLLFFSFSVLMAQNDIPIGHWKAYFSEKSFPYLTQSKDKLFLATPLSYIEMDKDDGSQLSHTKVNGLSHAKVNLIKFDMLSESLIVTYENSVFDVIDKYGSIFTFSAIQSDGNFLSRTINDIYIDDHARAYFSCAFGVVVFDLNENTFVETYDFETSVYGVTVFNNTIYIASEDGVLFAQRDSGLNLQDINTWNFYDVGDGFPAVYSSKAICNKFDKLFFDVNGDLFVKTENSIDSIISVDNYKISYLSGEGKGLLIGFEKGNSGKLFYLDSENKMLELPSNCTGKVGYGIEDENGTFWIGSYWHDLREINGPNDNNCTYHSYNAPYALDCNDVALNNGNIYIATAYETHLPPSNKNGMLEYSDGIWKRWSANIPYLKETNAFGEHTKVIIHPKNDKVYIASFEGGLIEKDGDQLKVYNSSNSLIGSDPNGSDSERIAGIAFDKDDNLWMANNIARKPICVMKADGTWKNFSVPSQNDLRDLIIDENGYKWFSIYDKGILVFDDNQTIDDTTDDRYRVIRKGDNLPDQFVGGMAMDLNGDIWVGTRNGVVVFDCGTAIFDNCKASNRIIGENEFDDENAYLLNGENIYTVAIDGANRKWFGTDNGVFVLSASGQEQVAHFDSKNSPLPDNVVRDIEIEPSSGDVYIGTRYGLVVYRSDATGAKKFHSTKISVFPNPVRPDYSGPIAINGLAENANVKITDISGKLFFETKALGGQAIWNGTDYNGSKAATGVYLVFSTNADNSNPEAIVTKILFIK